MIVGITLSWSLEEGKGCVKSLDAWHWLAENITTLSMSNWRAAIFNVLNTKINKKYIKVKTLKFDVII